MEAPNIKHLKKMSNPHARKRDGEILTHSVHLGLTTDEAILISEHFTQFRKEGKPCKSFARLFLLQLAENALTEEALIAEMTKWRTRAKLAEELSSEECQKAMDLLAESKKPKPPKPQPPKVEQKPTPEPAPKKERREFVPPQNPRR